MSNQHAKHGQVFVCEACGKRSQDKYGNNAIDRGWDVSCMLHAVLCLENSVVFDKDGRVIKAEPVPTPKTTKEDKEKI